MTVAQLRAKLTPLNLDTRGTKAQLAARLHEALRWQAPGSGSGPRSEPALGGRDGGVAAGSKAAAAAGAAAVAGATASDPIVVGSDGEGEDDDVDSEGSFDDVDVAEEVLARSMAGGYSSTAQHIGWSRAQGGRAQRVGCGVGEGISTGKAHHHAWPVEVVR